MTSNVSDNKLIAMYLPQFHPIPENNKWWGEGFTEWTNVGRAKSLFKGHYQPRVPADLGYYDLRLPEVRQLQADMAREYGIDGFCYYHYWFGNGKRLLERPFNEVLQFGEPDFPFMLCWANESWHEKFWDNKGGVSKNLLMEQIYGDESEYDEHFYALLEAFKDHRYIRIGNKPAFMIYEPLKFPNISKFIARWQELAIKNGLDGIHFIGQTQRALVDKDSIISLGFNAINAVRIYDVLQKKSKVSRITSKLKRVLFKTALYENYSDAVKYLTDDEFDASPDVYPTILPGWDHTPRSGKGGFLLHDYTPELFAKHVRNVFKVLKNKPIENKITFIKSWNEWAEGNYLEPDMKFGKKFLEVIKKIKNDEC
jgi:lipopolysaccharide biosynthesis protein